MISEKAIKKALDLPTEIKTDPKKMAESLRLTVFPFEKQSLSSTTLSFYRQLRNELEELGVEFIPFKKALYKVSWYSIFKRFFWIIGNDLIFIMNYLVGSGQSNRVWMGQSAFRNLLKRKRIKPGISVLALGEYPKGDLPMDYTASFRRTSVITILEMPDHISKSSSFEEHFTTALDLFTHHMTNIVIGASHSKWLLYNFNASHPIFSRTENFRNNLLQALIPKIFAPIQPPSLSNFIIDQETFDANDDTHKRLVKDMVKGGRLLDKTELYPDGRHLEELSFRNSFYEWIGRLHIDKRNGMSFGFLARQMPVQINELHSLGNASDKKINIKEGLIKHGNDLYIIVEINNEKFALKLPEVWVLTQRSGSDKTDMDPVNDLVKLGLVSGKMHLRTPKGVEIQDGYRPSFDTKVILAHALGNAIAACIFHHFDQQQDFVSQITNDGMAIAHWHGYFNQDYIPEGYYIHGTSRPHVACSSPQSALFALKGKLNRVRQVLDKNETFQGDIHIEPHHGINVNCTSLKKLGEYLSNHEDASTLGNKYLRVSSN